MGAIEGLHEELTVCIIAHRLTTLRHCDTIIEVENGAIKRMGSYAEIVTNGRPEAQVQAHA